MEYTWYVLGGIPLLLATVASTLASNDPTVNTNCGPVQGLAKDGAYSFRGIPYAEPPIGTLRWKAPVTLSKQAQTCWSGTFAAQTFGNTCFQFDVLSSSGEYIGSEDCLYLNVWTPTLDHNAKLPVMVWIHGGSLQFANGNWPTYSPSEKLAKETNVVYVSMNYRLHAFGFMALDLLSYSDPSGTSGNYGFLDQILALRWVQENVRNFGGDPTQVTVFGQSSGGTSIFALLASPLVEGLFQKAWLSSASPILNKTTTEAAKDNLVFLRNAKCTDLDCLYHLTSEQVINAVPWDVYPAWRMADQMDIPTQGQFYGAMAVVDGVVVKEAPFDYWAHGYGLDIPLLIGSVAQEIDYHPNQTDVTSWNWTRYEDHVTRKLSTFSPAIAETALRLYPSHVMTPEYQLTSMASDLTSVCGNGVLAFSAEDRYGFTAPIYRYVGTSRPSKPIQLRSFGISFEASYSLHAWDIFAFFGTIDQFINPMAASDIAWQTSFRREVMSFVRTGHPASPSWGPVPNITAVLTGNETKVVDFYKPKECAFWMSNGFFSYSWIN